jgi:hypothetical protein
MKRITLIILLILSLTFTAYAEIPLNEQYTQEELDYFYEIAFGLEHGKSNVIHKWDKPEINVSIAGNPTKNHTKELNRVMKELTNLTSIKFKIVDKNADIKVYFINHSDFTKHTSNNKLVQNSYGYFYTWWDRKNVIYKANVFIALDKGVMGEYNHLIREEFTQSLGLMNDSNTYVNSIFYQGTGVEREYTYTDEAIIKLLYEPKIKPGMTKSKIEKLFKKR